MLAGLFFCLKTNVQKRLDSCALVCYLLSMVTETETEPRKRGPEPKGFESFNVNLPRDLGEWGKRRPEGLSATVRRLLTELKVKEEQGENA